MANALVVFAGGVKITKSNQKAAACGHLHTSWLKPNRARVSVQDLQRIMGTTQPDTTLSCAGSTTGFTPEE